MNRQRAEGVKRSRTLAGRLFTCLLFGPSRFPALRNNLWKKAAVLRCVMHTLALSACFSAALAWTPPALAHAALLATDPPASAILAAAPSQITLTFNEPVSPLVFKFLGPDGDALPLGAVRQRDKAVEVALPALGASGSYALSWRVVSADGHPVGGALVFSLGAPGTAPALANAVHPLRSPAIWAARLVFYFGLFFGVGAVVFRAFLAAPEKRQRVRVPILAGAAAVLVSLALFGLDALDAPWSYWYRPAVWQTALSTSAGIAAILALLAFAFAWGSQAVRGRQCKVWALLALALMGLSLAATGHASAAPPYWLSRPSVWLHGAALALWIGSLMPLARALRDAGPPDLAALRRFSRCIPFSLWVLVASGGVLVWLQLDRLTSLWETSYGRVLLAKLALVAVLLGLGAFNRYRLTRAALRGEAPMRRRMRRVIMAEAAVAVAILGVAALWRFTPPPRALAAAAANDEISMHIGGSGAMAQLLMRAPRPGRPGQLRVFLFDANMAPLNASEVSFWFSNSQVGIEPIEYKAVRGGDGGWEALRLELPDLPNWSLRIDALISDFDRLSLTADLGLKH